VAVVEFRVQGDPVPQPRHRVARGRAYLPRDHPVLAWKGLVTVRARQAFPGGPLAGPAGLEVWFVLKPPASFRRPHPRLWAAKKPDADNLLKAFCDALNGVCWADDAQVVRATCHKVYAASDEQPHALAHVESLGELPCPLAPGFYLGASSPQGVPR
jgi:Holliday junction resolvase RusA-like endonuclease